MRYPAVIIEWMDSVGVTDSWENWDALEPMEPARITTVGFLICEDATSKTVAQSVSEKQVVGRICIPAGTIASMKRIK